MQSKLSHLSGSFKSIFGYFLQSPNSPFTIVIFEKDFYKFKEPIENLYDGKNICVKGKIVEYKGMEEIIVTEPKEIVVL